MPLFSDFMKIYPFVKMYITCSPMSIPWVNQFPYTHSAETETHIYFRPKSAETFDLPGISRQQSDCLDMYAVNHEYQRIF